MVATTCYLVTSSCVSYVHDFGSITPLFSNHMPILVCWRTTELCCCWWSCNANSIRQHVEYMEEITMLITYLLTKLHDFSVYLILGT
jgi:hypothetical protein